MLVAMTPRADYHDCSRYGLTVFNLFGGVLYRVVAMVDHGGAHSVFSLEHEFTLPEEVGTGMQARTILLQLPAGRLRGLFRFHVRVYDASPVLSVEDSLLSVHDSKAKEMDTSECSETVTTWMNGKSSMVLPFKQAGGRNPAQPAATPEPDVVCSRAPSSTQLSPNPGALEFFVVGVVKNQDFHAVVDHNIRSIGRHHPDSTITLVLSVMVEDGYQAQAIRPLREISPRVRVVLYDESTSMRYGLEYFQKAGSPACIQSFLKVIPSGNSGPAGFRTLWIPMGLPRTRLSFDTRIFCAKAYVSLILIYYNLQQIRIHEPQTRPVAHDIFTTETTPCSHLAHPHPHPLPLRHSATLYLAARGAELIHNRLIRTLGNEVLTQLVIVVCKAVMKARVAAAVLCVDVGT